MLPCLGSFEPALRYALAMFATSRQSAAPVPTTHGREARARRPPPGGVRRPRRPRAGAQVGELMDGRYEVFATHGKGVFSTVLRAKDRGGRPDAAGAFPEVAVKVIRANDVMFKAGARRALAR